MKVKELIEILSNLNQENELVMQDNNSNATIGATPVLRLDTVFQGFDWDTGKTFLYFKDKGDTSTSA